MIKTKPTQKKGIKQPGAGTAQNEKVWLWFSLAIVVLSLILYINTLQNSYALDDKGIITQNKITSRGFSGIPDLLTTSYWEGIGKNVRSYRPLAPVSFAVEVGIWGKNPMVSHFFNLVIYMLTGVILLFFLRRVFEKADPGIPPVIPFLVTMLFLAHPIHTEVVANIKSRDSMFELLFLLLSGYFLFKYLSSKRRSDLVVSVLFFFPALLSKESAITYLAMVPVILILFDDRPFVKKLETTVFYLIPAILFLILYYNYSNIRVFSQLHILDNALLLDAPIAQIWATKFLILGKYLVLLVYPHPLVFDYSYNHIPLTDFSNPAVWLSVFIYFFATAFLVYILKNKLSVKKVTPGNRVIAFSVAWFIMGFFASSNLVFLIGSTMGERFMYSPSLGFIIILVYGLYRAGCLAGKGKKFAGASAVMVYLFCAVLLTGYGLKTIDRNKAWKDDRTLYSTDIRYLGDNTKANDFLADLYRKDGDLATDQAMKSEYYGKAIVFKEKALSIYPKVPEIQQQLAYLYGNTGQFGKAVEAYKVAIAMNPGEIMNYVQIGKALGMMQKIQEGLTYLKQAEQIDPNDPDLLATLGITYAQTGELGLAISYFEKVLSRDPSNKQIADYLARAKNQVNKQKK